MEDLSAVPGVAAPPPVLNIWSPDAVVFRLLTGRESMLSVAESMEREYTGAPDTAEAWELRRAGVAAWVAVTFCPSKLVLAVFAVTVAEISYDTSDLGSKKVNAGSK